MAEKDPEKRPIIIKKIKKGGHGHHGGAWKVAYADFVTAMMAFFLLLWLLSSSSKATLNGIAEYFTPTVGIKDAAGIGFDGGISPNVKGKQKNEKTTPGVVTGQSPTGQAPESPETPAPVEATEDGFLFDKAKEEIKQAFESDPNLREFSDNILVEQTPEGLKIEMVDTDKYPMFTPGTAELTDAGRAILTRMVKVIEKAPNFISLTGHTDASGSAAGNINYSNWELSADRANASRRFMQKVGLDPERAKKVVGMADKELIDEKDPRAAKNRRIAVILLRGSHMNLPDSQRAAARDLLNAAPQNTVKEGAESPAGTPLKTAPKSDKPVDAKPFVAQ